MPNMLELMPLKSQTTLGLSKIVEKTGDQVGNWTSEVQFQLIISNSVVTGHMQSDTYRICVIHNWA